MSRDGELSNKIWSLFSFNFRCARVTMTNKLILRGLTSVSVFGMSNSSYYEIKTKTKRSESTP